MTDEVVTSAPETDAVTAEQPDASAKPNPTETVEWWREQAKKQEKRAKENAEAAKRLAQIEDAQKSETQKLNEQIEAARADAADARAQLLRYSIASKHGITDADDIDLFLTGTDEDTLSRQAERLVARNAEAGAPRSPKPDPTQGRSGGGPKSTADSFAEFFQNQV